jgi:hypothetical protein
LKHPASVSENVLERHASGSGAKRNVTVTTHGYEGIPRIDVIPMLGGVGNMHPIPAPWTEYLPISQNSTMVVSAVTNRKFDDDADDEKLQKGWHSAIQQHGISPENVIVRGALAAALFRQFTKPRTKPHRRCRGPFFLR